MKHYIYKTTNLINGKIYIGYHHSEDIENDPYLGSGEVLLRAIRYHGKNNFKREILFEFDNQDDAYKKERELVDAVFIKRTDTYNVKTGGKGWEIGTEPHNVGKMCIYSPLTNKNYYINEKDLQFFLDDGYVLGCLSLKDKTPVKKNNVIKYITQNKINEYLNNGWEKTSTTDGKICVTHIKTNKLKYINEKDIKLYEQNGYQLGNKKSGINKGTIYISKDKKNKRIFEYELNAYIKDGWRQKRHQKEVNFKRMRNEQTKELKNVSIEFVDEYLKNGWVHGNGYSANKGTIYITKDKKNKRINKESLNDFLKLGWSKGMYNSKYHDKMGDIAPPLIINNL